MPSGIEESGINPIDDYLTYPDENKYILRLNFEAKLWGDID